MSAQATGEDFSVDERRPFRALLDVGLIRTTTGNRVFGALKVSHVITVHFMIADRHSMSQAFDMKLFFFERFDMKLLANHDWSFFFSYLRLGSLIA